MIDFMALEIAEFWWQATGHMAYYKDGANSYPEWAQYKFGVQ